MSGPIKSIVKSTLRKFGYTISKVEPVISNEVAPRKVVNAYYKGQCFKCFLGDCISDYILTGKGWDNQLEEILSKIVAKPECNVVEIGANIGASLIPIASLFPSFTFHCVEPIPEFFELLKANKESYCADNVKVYNKAITAKDGDCIDIHIQNGTAGSVFQYDGHQFFGTSRVSGVTIDSLFKSMDIALLKLDVDGFELSVLKGAIKTLERCRPQVFMEFHPKLMAQANVTPSDITSIFEKLDYDNILIWDNFGAFLKSTDSYAELQKIANEAEFYVDILVKRTRHN